MTHIIIPINVIEKKIKNCRKNINRGTFLNYWEGRLDALSNILSHHIAGKLAYKQMSLNEEDIDNKGLKKYPVVADYIGMSSDGTRQYGKDFNEPYRNAYKQALNDLL